MVRVLAVLAVLALLLLALPGEVLGAGDAVRGARVVSGVGRIEVQAEGAHRALERPLPVDLAVGADGTFRPMTARGARVPAGRVVRSFLVTTSPGARRGGTAKVRFTRPIVALIASDRLLDRTEGAAGQRRVAAERGVAGRGIAGSPRAALSVSRDRRTLTLRLAAGDTAQVRVIVIASVVCDPLYPGTPGPDVYTVPADSPGKVVCGGEGDDILTGGNENDTILGGPGKDTIDGRGGSDTIEGGLDDDDITGGEGDDLLRGDDGPWAAVAWTGAGADVIRGGPGSDHISGQGGADTLIGGDDNDLLYPGSGNDSIDGGPGVDEIYYDGSSDKATENPAPIRVQLGRGSASARNANDRKPCVATGQPHPQFGLDTIRAIETVWGTNQDDCLIGSAAGEDFFGRGGNDRILAGAGDDALHGDDPYCFDQATWLNDPERETAWNKWCLPDNVGPVPYGNDTLEGGSGDDRLFGGLGDDVMDGGPGAGDMVSYAVTTDPLRRAVTVNLGVVGPVERGHGKDTITRIEGAHGGPGNDRLTGTAAANVLIGGPGSDKLFGLAGPDELTAGYLPYRYAAGASEADDGEDTLRGGPDDDVLRATNADGETDLLDGGPSAFDWCARSAGDVAVSCHLGSPAAAAVRSGASPASLPGPARSTFYLEPNHVVRQREAADQNDRRFRIYRITISRSEVTQIWTYLDRQFGTTFGVQMCQPFALYFDDFRTRNDPRNLDEIRNGVAAQQCEADLNKRDKPFRKALVRAAAIGGSCLRLSWEKDAGVSLVRVRPSLFLGSCRR